MDWEDLLEELSRLAQRLGVEVRLQPTAGRVGRCVLRGKPVIVLDVAFRVRDRAEALAMMLADCDTEEHYIPEAVREFLARHRQPDQLPLFTARDDGARASPGHKG